MSETSPSQPPPSEEHASPRPGARRPTPVVVRPMREADFDPIIDISLKHYPDDTPWTPEYFRSHLHVFPQGQLVAELPEEDNRIVGYAASLIIRWDDYDFNANWDMFTDRGWFTNHDPIDGRTLYGADVIVDPTMQGRGIGKAIYSARAELCRSLNLRRIRAGARLVGYHRYAGQMSAEAYVLKVIRNELGDPTLSFQLKRGFRVIAVVPDYLRRDPKSLGYAAVIEWINHQVARRTDYSRRDPRFGRPRPGARKHPPQT